MPKRISRRRLIPNPVHSDVDARRFQHSDLAQLTTREIWSERFLIELSLARRIVRRARPRMIWIYPELVTDLEWLERRARRLRAEMRRRRRVAA